MTESNREVNGPFLITTTYMTPTDRQTDGHLACGRVQGFVSFYVTKPRDLSLASAYPELLVQIDLQIAIGSVLQTIGNNNCNQSRACAVLPLPQICVTLPLATAQATRVTIDDVVRYTIR